MTDQKRTTSIRKPEKAKVSDAEFRLKLKNIADWRKKQLAQLADRLRQNHDS